jgi:nucleoside-diphosphate-sugar epimerase
MLLERGLSVRVLDALYFGGEPLRPLQDHPQFELLKGDVRNLDRFPELFSDVDAVVHLAGLANDPSCDLNPDLSLSINLHGTLDVAKGAIKAGVQRFIFASSCSVYGTGTERILTETSPLNPVSLYARTKTESERELLRLTGPEFCPVCLRQATVFGLSPRMRFDLAINLMTLHGSRKRAAAGSGDRSSTCGTRPGPSLRPWRRRANWSAARSSTSGTRARTIRSSTLPNWSNSG